MNLLERIHTRLLNVHNEDPTVDYMQELAQLMYSPNLYPMEDLNFGDYVHAYMSDSKDPAAVGYLDRVTITEGGIWYQLQGDGVATDRRWRHCNKITHAEGQRLLSEI